MPSIQEHRDSGEEREQDKVPSFPQPDYPAGCRLVSSPR